MNTRQSLFRQAIRRATTRRDIPDTGNRAAPPRSAPVAQCPCSFQQKLRFTRGGGLYGEGGVCNHARVLLMVLHAQLRRQRVSEFAVRLAHCPSQQQRQNFALRIQPPFKLLGDCCVM